MALAALIAATTMLISASCSTQSRTDVQRADALRDDPIFGVLQDRWRAEGEMSSQAASETGIQINLTEVRQSYVSRADFDPLAELSMVATMLADQDWSGLTAECDSLAVWGYRRDQHGDIFGSVRLRRPGEHALDSFEDHWQASVELVAESVLEGTDPYTDAGDLSCLNL